MPILIRRSNLQLSVEAFNAEVKGLRERCEVWCHTCWGSPAAQRVASRDQSYKMALPYFDQLDVDVITVEAAFKRSRIFITQPIAGSALERLRSVADVEVNPDSDRILAKDRLCAAVREHDILFALLHDTVDSDVLTANPKLKAVASMSANADRIDVAAATVRRIPVTVIPAVAVTEATADLHFGLLLTVARRIVEGDRLVHAGLFPGAQSNRLAGVRVWGKVLGLVGGKGRIGQAVARRATGFRHAHSLLWPAPHGRGR